MIQKLRLKVPFSGFSGLRSIFALLPLYFPFTKVNVFKLICNRYVDNAI